MIKKEHLVFFLLTFIAISSINAQTSNIADALSRMESSIDASQEEFTMRDSYFLGRTAAAYIINRYPLYTEKPEITNYLNLICKALAINSPFPEWYNGYHVMILDTNEINAFATPGGHIFITRGILELTSSEDMLASIIAHELAHVQLKHGIANLMHTRFTENLRQERERISGNLSGETQQVFNQSANEIVHTLLSGGYSQLQEFEADSTALNLLISAGYYPGSLIELLRIFERLYGNQIAGLNSTHPIPSLRIANLERNMPNFPVNNSRFRRERFERIMGR